MTAQHERRVKKIFTKSASSVQATLTTFLIVP